MTMRATVFLLVALSAPSPWVLPCFCAEGAATAASLGFVTAARTSTSRSPTSKTPARSRQQQQQQQQHQQQHPRSPRAGTGASYPRVFGRLAGLDATSTGGDEVVSVRTETTETTPDATRIEEEGDSPALERAVGTRSPHLGAYWAILRPQNIPSSFGLVAAGALVASHTVGSMLDPKVLLTAFAAASVSVGSCVLNDWFDIELDRVNEPDRPLVTGEVKPVHALAIGLGFLLAAVVSASAVHPAALQGIIVASVALTLAYTPVLKPIPLVKNCVVALVIAAAIAAGGLAAGAGVAATLTPSVLTFFVIAHREILMDITDVEGDREAGVRTLPVLLGRDTALALAAALLTAGVGAAGVGIAGGTTDSARPAAMALSLLFVLPLYANVFQVARSSYSYEKLSSAVDQALGPLALVLGLMGFVLR